MRLQPISLPRLPLRVATVVSLVEFLLSVPSLDSILMAIMASLAYLFALRVPSELLRQFRRSLLRCSGSTWIYGPIRRKGCSQLVCLTRSCVCATKSRVLCPHTWGHYLSRFGHLNVPILSTITAASFNDRLRKALSTIGVTSGLCQYSSHSFRHGCAKDILQHAGPAAMMKHCGWASASSAFHYVSRDEVDQSIVASMLADNSEDDS